jgi:hypothetical protein
MPRPQPKKKCFAKGCQTRIPCRLLMCATHWAMVPRGLQLAVNTHNAARLRGMSAQPYIDIIRTAAEAVAAKEAAKQGVNDAAKETDSDSRRR